MKLTFFSLHNFYIYSMDVKFAGKKSDYFVEIADRVC